jgi:predicted house-cleaning noncanonical NTP pyrophosphatase (MazG superfamily)
LSADGWEQAARDISEELADVLEVTDALVEAYGLDREEIGAIQRKKRDERGRFEEGYFLR